MATLSREAAANCAALAVRDDVATVLDQARDLRALGPGLDVSVPIPLQAPLGSGVVAWRSADEQARWLEAVPAATRPHHAAVLAATRERGFSVELATPPEAQLRDTVARHGNPGAGMTELLLELAAALAAREDYLVVDLDPAGTYLLSTINAPVFEARELTLLLSLNGFSTPLSGEQVTALGARVMAACAAITQAL
jgi:hypothetical protein